MTDLETDRLAVSVTEATRITGVGRNMIFTEIAAGRLPAKKAGTRTLIRIADLEAWLDSLPARETAA